MCDALLYMYVCVTIRVCVHMNTWPRDAYLNHSQINFVEDIFPF